jgi:hypothetical protein
MVHAEALQAYTEPGCKQRAIDPAQKAREGTVVHTGGRRSPNNRWALAEGESLLDSSTVGDTPRGVWTGRRVEE